MFRIYDKKAEQNLKSNMDRFIDKKAEQKADCAHI